MQRSYIISLSFNYGIAWSQVTYILDDKETTNINNFSFKIDKDFIRAKNVRTIWNEIFRNSWRTFVQTDKVPVLEIWKGRESESPFHNEYDIKDNRSSLGKIFMERTEFLNSDEHFEIRMADIFGTIIHRYQNKGQNKEIYEQIMKHISGKKNNYSHLILNDRI